METYALSEKYVLLVTPDAAATMLLHDAKTDPDRDPDLYPVSEDLAAALASRTAWDIVRSGDFAAEIKDLAWENISDAVDLVQLKDPDENAVYCSEFTGTAELCPEFPGAMSNLDGLRYEDDYVLYFRPTKTPMMFAAAYDSPDGLLSEYRSRLAELFGDDFPFENFIASIGGTYIC